MVPVRRNHINVVITNPERFGMTREQIGEVYQRYGEPLGLEGRAREEIVRALISIGWIRIRDYGPYLSVQVHSMDEYNTAERLHSFFKRKQWQRAAETDVKLGLLKENKVRIINLKDFELLF